jgi:hypothetical protein
MLFWSASNLPPETVALTISLQRKAQMTLDQPTTGAAFRRRNRRIPGADRTRRAFFALAVASLLPIAGCSSSSQSINQQTVEGKQPDGTVEMSQVQAAFIGSGGGGSGTLNYRGRSYPFAVGGLGIGGIGASTINAQGEVYGLKQVSDFPGAYAQGRYGAVIGNASAGDLWLQNDKGVVMHLKAKRTGLMLSLGGDAVIISMQ